MKDRKRWIYGLGSGVLAAFLASLCCTGPALLAFLGLSGLGASLGLAGHHTALTGLFLALAAVTLWTLRRSKVTDCQQQCHPKKGRSSLALPALLITGLIVGYLTILYPAPNRPGFSQSKPAASPFQCTSCEK